MGDPDRRIFSAGFALNQFVGEFINSQEKFRVERADRAEALRARCVAVRLRRLESTIGMFVYISGQ